MEIFIDPNQVATYLGVIMAAGAASVILYGGILYVLWKIIELIIDILRFKIFKQPPGFEDAIESIHRHLDLLERHDNRA